MRALSTVFLLVALAHPASAQFPGGRRDYSGNALWLSAGSGTMRGASVSDEKSGGSWSLQTSKPVQLALDWGRSDRSIGVTVRRNEIPMTYQGSGCVGCSAQVQSLVVLGTYRRAAPLFGSALQQITELGAGMTRWNGVTGRDGDVVPVAPANNDFTYSLAIGIGLPIGEGFEVTMHYDVVSTYHERATQGPGDKATSVFVGLSTLRFGARLRLGK